MVAGRVTTVTSATEAGTALATPVSEPHGHPLPARTRIGLFGAVSVGTAVLGQVAILVLHVGLGVGPVLANALATVLVAVVGYWLCTRFVWTSDASLRYSLELPGFVVSSVLGLAISTGTVDLAAHYSRHPLVPNLASAAGFAVAWGLRFVILDRWVFHRHGHVENAAR